MSAPSPPTLVSRWMEATRGDRSAGLTMVAAATVALVWANVAGGSYLAVWSRRAPWSAPLGLDLTVRDWVDQGLLVAFFAVVGLEIRREVVAGELRTVRRALVPAVAALTGMAVPALIYTALVAGGPGAGAWGIPMATDVAFALGALALIGGGSARSRVFLMTLAVVDDIGSIVVLVVFYSHRTRFGWLVAGLVCLAVLAALWTTRRPWGAVRVALAAAGWWAFLHAGVEAAVVGVALGAFGPRRRSPGQTISPRVRVWILRLEPPVNAVVLPLFALANVGLRLSGSVLTSATAVRIFSAVVVARVIGKPLGIVAGATLAARCGHTAIRPGLSSRALLGVGTVATIGFTVPLLIIQTALPPGARATGATAGLLVSSLVGGVGGLAVLRPGRASGARRGWARRAPGAPHPPAAPAGDDG